MVVLEDKLNEKPVFIDFCENGYILAVGCKSQVLIFDLRKGKCIKNIEDFDDYQFIKFDVSANFLAIGSQRGIVKVYETKKWNEV